MTGFPLPESIQLMLQTPATGPGTRSLSREGKLGYITVMLTSAHRVAPIREPLTAK